MKVLKTVFATVMTVALLCSTVMAAEVSSPEKSDGPKVVAATTASGEDITAKIMTTRLGSKSSFDAVNASLEGAKADLDAALNNPAALKGANGTLEADLQKALDANNTGAKVADLKIAEIFDAAFVDGGEVKAIGEPVTISFEYDFPTDNAVIVIHSPVTGEWEVIDASKVRYENGRVVVTLDSLSPIGFLTTPIVKVAEDSATTVVNAVAKADDTVKSAQTGEHVAVYVVIIAVALAAAGVVCVKRAKTSAK